MKPDQRLPIAVGSIFVLLQALWGPVGAAVFDRSLDLSNASLRSSPVSDAMFGANIGYWSVVSGSGLVASAQEAGLTVLRYHPGTYNDAHTVPGSVNQWDFTAVDAFGAQRLADFGRFLLATATTGQIHINYGAGSPAQAAALAAYLCVPLDAPTSILNRSLGSAVTEPSIIPPYTRTRDWRTAGFWAQLRAASPLPVDDGFNKLRIAHAAPFPVRYFECGNEADYKFVPCLRYRLAGENSITQGATGYGGRRADARTYANFYAATKALIQEIVPTAQVGASAGYFEQADNDTDSAAVPYLFPGGTGTTKAWTPVMLTRLRELGVTPDFIIAHRYTQQTDFAWNNDYLLRGALNAYLAPGTGSTPRIHVTELNWGENESIPFTTTIQNAVNLARSFGDALQSDVNNLCWFTFTSGSANYNAAETTGWRKYHNWGIIADDPLAGQTPNSGALAWPGLFAGVRFPVFHAFALLREFVRPGDRMFTAGALAPANTNSAEVTVFASRGASGDFTFLVLNKSATLHQLNLTLSNASLSEHGQTLSGLRYGLAQDEEQRLKAIATPPVTTNNSREAFALSRTGGSIVYSVPAQSVSVLRLPKAPLSMPSFVQPLGAEGVKGVPFSHVLSATGGSITFSAAVLPAGISFSPANATLSGTPVSAGDFAFNLTAANSVGTVTGSFRLSVRDRVSQTNYSQDFSAAGSGTLDWWSYQGDGGVSGTLSRGAFGPSGTNALQHQVTINPAVASYWYAGMGTNLSVPTGLSLANLREFTVSLRVWSGRASDSDFDIFLKTSSNQTLSRRVTVPGQTWTDVAFTLMEAVNNGFNPSAAQLELILAPVTSQWPLASATYRVTGVSLTQSIPTDTAAQAWRRGQFDSILPLGDAAEDADPDGDGFANLLEYALGTLPKNPISQPNVVPGLFNDHLTLTFTPMRLEGLAFTIDTAQDPQNWVGQTEVTQVLSVGQAYRHTDTVSSASNLARFLRLRVEPR